MARRRMIDPCIWQSEDFSKLSLMAKLLFIGMFSMADDEGRGRAKPVYLKSIIFPYDDGMRLIDVEKALSEIGSNMSVTFYAHDGNSYYCLNNWTIWQRVDKPQASKIPAYTADLSDSRIIPESVQNDSRISPESFQNHSCLKEKKLKEVKRREGMGSFAAPTLEEIKDYCSSRSNDVDPQKFYDYFEASGWVDSKGNKVRNWKQKIITWEKRGDSGKYEDIFERYGAGQ